MTHHIIEILNWLAQCSQLLDLLPMMGCIAVWKPKGVQIAKKYLQNCFANNKEGAGFAIAKNGKIEIQKGFFTFEDFWKAYQSLQKYAALIHFRIATHGEVNEENCHPFTMNKGEYALVHNGILPSSLHSDNKKESDSRQFAELLEDLIPMVPFGNEKFGKVVGEAIGYNKVAILNPKGKVWLFNEQKGTWHNGAWYSNNGYAYGPFTRAWKSAATSVAGMWNSLARPSYEGFGTREKPVYSELHHSVGYYDYQGDWIKMRDYEPKGYYNVENEWVSTDDIKIVTEEEETAMQDEIFNAACAGTLDDNDDSEREPTDEEIAAAGEARSLAELEGDLEFAPETEYERHVANWIKKQDALARQQASDGTEAIPSTDTTGLAESLKIKKSRPDLLVTRTVHSDGGVTMVEKDKKGNVIRTIWTPPKVRKIVPITSLNDTRLLMNRGMVTC